MKTIQNPRILLVVFALFMGAFTYAQNEANAYATVEEINDNVKTKQTTIVTYLAGSDNFSTLVSAVTAAGLVDTLSGEGPFTVFAPTNEAFDRLGEEQVSELLKPENLEKLKSILTYHVIAGKADAASVVDAINKGGGKAEFKTVSGNVLTASLSDGNVYLIDEKGNSVKVTETDLKQSNGIIHVIDNVIIPVNKAGY